MSILCLGQEGPNTSQTSRSISLNQPLKVDIAGGETHSYAVLLSANQRVRVTVRRHKIDLSFSIVGPASNSEIQFENPAGPESSISALVETPVSGTWLIKVRPVKKWLARGTYEIVLEDSAGHSITDDQRLLAQLKVAEGRRLRLLGTPESNQSALLNYADAASLWGKINDRFEEANALQFAAQHHVALGDLQKADENFLRALALRADDPQSQAYTVLDRADAYYFLKSPKDSLPFYEQAVTAFQKNQDWRGEAMARLQIGLVYMALYQWADAKLSLEAAHEINRIEGDKYQLARVLNALGGVFDSLGDPQKAIDLYEQARASVHGFDDLVAEGNLYNNIGLLQDTWGESSEALRSYDKALELLEKGLAAGNADRSYVDRKRASVFYNRGSLYITLGDFLRGRSDLQKSIDLRPPRARAGPLTWFAYASILDGDSLAALKYCEEALTVQAAGTPGIAQTYTTMGMAHDALGDHQKALEYFNKAVQIQQNPDKPDWKGLAITLDKRGALYAAMGNATAGRKDLDQALVLWRRFKDRNGETGSMFQLARLERNVSNDEVGLKLAEAAIALVEPLRKNVTQQLRAAYFATKVDYYDLSIDLAMRLSTKDGASNRLGEAFNLSERERARSLLEIISAANLEAENVLDPGLSELLSRRQRLDRTLTTSSSKRTQLLLQKTVDAQAVATLDRELARLQAELGNVLKEIQNRYPHYAELASFEPLGFKDIQRELDDESVLLEYALGEERSYVWALTRDSIKGFQLEPRDKIEAVANRMVQSITARNREVPNETFQQRKAREDQADKDYDEAAGALSKLVIAPIESELGQKRLVIVADGALQYVPFSSLPLSTTASTSTTLIATHEIVSLPSASVLALQRRELANRKPAPFKLAVLADPVFDVQDERVVNALARSNPSRRTKSSSANGGQPPQTKPSPITPKHDNSTLVSALRDVGLNPDGTLRRLITSRAEASEISRTVPARESLKALDFNASRATALSGELSKYQYVHFATHGLLSLEHPELSGIALSMVDEKGQKQDGYLRLYEIYNLNLPAELVVLSACETGVGKQIRGEGLIALTRGFMYAGAKRVVASLWKVDDSATAELMAQFYKEMFVNKLRPAEALKKAQITISQQKRWRHPYYWAGFVLQGDWR